MKLPLRIQIITQVLLSIGYIWLDVRPMTEVDLRGKVKGSINIPLEIQNRKFDPEKVRGWLCLNVIYV